MDQYNDAGDYDALAARPGALISIDEHQDERDHLIEDGGDRPKMVSTK